MLMLWADDDSDDGGDTLPSTAERPECFALFVEPLLGSAAVM